MNYSRRQLYALGEPLGESATRLKPGGRVYGGGGSPSTPADTTNTTTAELPEWARGYAKDTLAKASTLTDINTNPYQQYGGQRIAGFQPMQQQAFQGAANMQPSQQLGTGSDLATAAGIGALGTNYQAGQFSNQFQDPGQYQPGQFSMMQAQGPSLQNYQMQGPQDVQATGYDAAEMDAAQTGYNPNLQNYQMGPAERVRAQNFDSPSAQQYMNPYTQNVVDYQKSQALRDFQIAQPMRQAQAVQQGAFGGSRSAIIDAEAQRTLNSQLQGIEATGQQAAFQNAQQQFNADQARRLQAQQANQQAGLTVGGQNLGANLGVQQLGAQTGLQTSLANLSNQQQANVQNQAARNQAMGMNAQQAMQAALANQQMGYNVGSQNLSANLGVQQLGAGQNLQAQLANQQAFQQAQSAAEQSRQYGAGQGLQAANLGAQYGQSAQQLGEQSRQYGAGLGMQGLQTALQGAGQLGQLGQTQYGQQMGINQLQSQYGQQQQQQAQRPLDMAYQDFANQQNYPYKQLGFMSDMIRGLPLGQQSTSQMYQAPPSALQTVGALGLGAYGINQLSKADGGLLGAYAGGGMVAFGNGGDTDVTDSPMDDPTEMAKAVSKLSDEQLQQIIQNPSSAAELQAAKMELATRASESRGLASAYNTMPEQAPSTQAVPQAPMMQAARGGIMGFAGDDQSLVTEDKMREVFAELNDDDEAGYGGNAEDNAFYKNEGRRIYSTLANEKASAPMTEAQRRASTKAYYQEIQDMAGASPYAAQEGRIAGLEKQQAENLGQQKGLAALAAIPAILQGGNALRGLGGAGGAFAGMYGKAIQADRAEKLSLMSAKNNLEEAQYKTRVGMVGEARQLTAEARRDTQAAEAARIAKLKALGTVATAQERASRPPKAATRNFDIESVATIAKNLKNITPPNKGETPEQYNNRIESMATFQFVKAKNAREIDSTSNVTSTVSSTSDIAGTKGDVEQQKADTSAMAAEEASLKDARADLAKLKRSNLPKNQKKWQDLLKEHGSEQAAGEAHIKNYMVTNPTGNAAPAKPAAAPAKAAAAPTATTAPSLNEFLVAARKSNPGVSDADLTTFYNNKYAKK
jgi:hypothetical protein